MPHIANPIRIIYPKIPFKSISKINLFLLYQINAICSAIAILLYRKTSNQVNLVLSPIEALRKE